MEGRQSGPAGSGGRSRTWRRRPTHRSGGSLHQWKCAGAGLRPIRRGGQGRAGLNLAPRVQSQRCRRRNRVCSRVAAAAVALVSWSRWGQKRKPGGNSCLSSQRWSCVSSQSSGGTIGRVGGWRKVRPTPLARGTGGVEKPASFTLLVLRPRRRSRFPAAWGVASSPPPHR